MEIEHAFEDRRLSMEILDPLKSQAVTPHTLATLDFALYKELFEKAQKYFDAKAVKTRDTLLAITYLNKWGRVRAQGLVLLSPLFVTKGCALSPLCYSLFNSRRLRRRRDEMWRLVSAVGSHGDTRGPALRECDIQGNLESEPDQKRWDSVW